MFHLNTTMHHRQKVISTSGLLTVPPQSEHGQLFGLCGAPATFCRVMAHVLGHHIGKICSCYLDGVIIFGRIQKVLFDRLDVVLQRLHTVASMFALWGHRKKPEVEITFCRWCMVVFRWNNVQDMFEFNKVLSCLAQ